MNPKERFINACHQKPVDRPPVWMMRQAGRYLPEYRAIRDKMPTLQMMKTPDVACEITLQPVERLGVDAAILYSDILILPEAMGMDLTFKEGVGPRFKNPIESPRDVEKLREVRLVDDCVFVYETIRQIRKRIPDNYPLLGFAGAPFTVGAYLIGKEGANEGKNIREFATKEPKGFHSLMKKLSRGTIDHLKQQAVSGVDAVQLFDTWAGVLSEKEYRDWAYPYQTEILRELRNSKIPTIFYIKGGSPHFKSMLETGCDVISVDWELSLKKAKKLAKGRVAIQGNLNPMALYQSPSKIEADVKSMIQSWGKGPGYIINLGHGMLKDIPVESAKAFVDAAKKYGVESL